MKTFLMRSLLTGAALLLGGINAQAETYTWSNNATTNLWGTADNWVGAPSLTFNSTTDVVFDNASVVSPANIIAINGNRTIRSLTINADYATSTNATFDIRTYATTGATARTLTFEAVSGNASITVAESTSGTAQVRLGVNNGGNLILNSNLDLTQNNTFFNSVGFQLDSAITGNGTINKSGAGLVRVLRANSGWSGGMNINEGNVTVSVQPSAMGTGAWTLGGGANNTALGFGKDVTYTNSGGIVVAAGAGTRTIQNDSNSVGNFTLSAGTIDLSAGKDLTFNVTANGAADTMTIASNITGTGGVVKSGNGTLTLGNSTYTGDTTVLAGTLAVNGFSIGNAQKLIIDGGKVAPTGTENVGTLFFGAAQQAAGTWGSSTSAATLPFQDDTRFSGTGVVVVGSPYTTWANSFGLQDPWLGVDPALDGTTTADPDNDGVTNLAEYAFGLTPTSGASVSPIKVQLNQTTGLFTYTRRKPSLTLLTYAYEYSTTLTGAWLPFTPDSTSTNSGNPIEEIIVDVPDSLLTNTKLFVRVTAE